MLQEDLTVISLADGTFDESESHASFLYVLEWRQETQTAITTNGNTSVWINPLEPTPLRTSVLLTGELDEEAEQLPSRRRVGLATSNPIIKKLSCWHCYRIFNSSGRVVAVQELFTGLCRLILAR
jgi:hypothetical protein